MTLPPLLFWWRRLVRLIDRLPGTRELHWRPALRRYWMPLRTAPLVSPSLGFLARELAGRAGVRPYRLRGPGFIVHVRHPRNDMWIVDEIFMQRIYEPPPEVLTRIAALGRPPKVVDLGGHAGVFGLFALSRFEGAKVTSVEPNPDNARLLSASRAASRLEDRWELLPIAAGTGPGTLRLAGDSFLTRVTDEGEGVEVEVQDVLPLLTSADLAKIDIEGGEWPLLEDERLKTGSLRAVVLELHEMGDPGYRERAVSLLRAAGFTPGPFFDERPDTTNLWAWR